MSGLKPCPFCGSTDLATSLGGGRLSVILVHCNGCGAEGPGAFVPDHGKTFDRPPFSEANRKIWDETNARAKEHAEKRWNERVP